MHTVAEIKAEILKLKPEEIHQLGKRVQELLKNYQSSHAMRLS